MYRKLTLLSLLLATFLPLNAHAGHIDDAFMEVPVTIPQQIGKWVFGLEALYIKRANDDFHYASTTTINGTPTAFTNSDRHVVCPHFEWGSELDISYYFVGDGRFAHFAWERVCGHGHGDKTGSSSLILAGPAVMMPAGIGTAPTQFLPNGLGATVGWNKISAKSDNDYNAVDFVFGQRMYFANRVVLAPFGGLRYASICANNHLHATAQLATPGLFPNTATGDIKMSSDYCGLGPRFGADVEIKISHAFSLIGSVGASLLAGKADQNTFSELILMTNGVTVAGSSHNDFHNKSQTKLVPELDVRLAVAYEQAISENAGFSAALGYRAEEYFGAEDFSQFSYFDAERHQSDFGHYGPYLSVEFNFT